MDLNAMLENEPSMRTRGPLDGRPRTLLAQNSRPSTRLAANGAVRTRSAVTSDRFSTTLTHQHLSLLIFALILIGLALLYLFPLSSAYSPASPSGVWMLREGQWAQVQGQLESSQSKTGGLSLRLCAQTGGCVSVYAPEQTDGTLDAVELKPGQAMRVWGEVASAQYGAKFLRAHRLELLTTSELNS